MKSSVGQVEHERGKSLHPVAVDAKVGLMQQQRPAALIDQALKSGMTGQIVLHIKEGRIMEVQRTEVIKV